MGKRAEQARKRRRLAQNGPAVAKTPVVTIDQEDASTSLIPPEDLAITIETLNALAEDPSELADKSMKDLKRALYNLQRVMAEGSTLGMCISSAYFALRPIDGTPFHPRTDIQAHP
mgnify:CR=1 FL=1|jgi:hypothetical protein